MKQASKLRNSKSCLSRRELFIGFSMSFLAGVCINVLFTTTTTGNCNSIFKTFEISEKVDKFGANVASSDVLNLQVSTQKEHVISPSSSLWNEEDLKVCTPNYKPLNLSWWNDIVLSRQADYDATKKTPPPKPIWLPGFPGSGNQMVCQLVQALTGGLGGTDVYEQTKGKECTPSLAATCKTHWPTLRYKIADPFRNLTSPVEMQQQSNETGMGMDYFFSSHYVVLLRNPMDSIPSYVNQFYEVGNNLQSHSVQVPEKHWRKMKDRNFKTHVENWVNQITAWHGYKEMPARLQWAMYLPYEQLTKVKYGPALTMQLAQAIRDAGYQDRKYPLSMVPCGSIPFLVKQTESGLHT